MSKIISGNKNDSEHIDEMLSIAYEHLWNGRFQPALELSQMAYDAAPDDYNAALCYAWALLENGSPARALELANLAVEIGGNALNPRLYRGFFLSRMSIYEGALSDLEVSIRNQQSLLVWSYINKARSLAGLGRYFEALEEIDRAIIVDGNKNPGLKGLKKWYKTAVGLRDLMDNGSVSGSFLLEEGEEALRKKEFWFSQLAAQKILSDLNLKELHLQAQLLELEAMLAMFQFRPALSKADKIKDLFKENERFLQIYDSLKKQVPKKDQAKTDDLPSKSNSISNDISVKDALSEDRNTGGIINIKKRIEFRSFPNQAAEFNDIKMFAFTADSIPASKRYLVQFDEQRTCFVGAEITFFNPLYDNNDYRLSGSAVWYLNGTESGRNYFSINVIKAWPEVAFVQSWGTEHPGFWQKGQGRLEIHINNQKVCERWFLIGNSEIEQSTDTKINKMEYFSEEDSLTSVQKHRYLSDQENPTNYPAEKDESLSLLMNELDGFVGLKKVKESMQDFVNYLEYLNERKRFGLNNKGNFSIHCIFQGNPGTGKTTISRLVGRIFKAMGLLEKGHVVEVDRAGLVGQYIGETAIKTEKVINEAMGGVLFIDEAYTLIKKSSGGQDFGQEAIDVLLKRMEDYSGAFVVIAAGYPEEMQTFIDSNPGLKSRFTHYFNFDDYSPDEMIEIFNTISSKEDFSIEKDALELLRKEFTRLYRKRDKSFGNARLVNKYFNSAKMQLSRRFIQMNEDEKTKEAMTSLLLADINAIITPGQEKTVSIPIDEESLSKALEDLNNLIGIDSVKKEINETVKLAKYFALQGEDITRKLSSHLVFLGNPGTGKTTVARIYSEIFSALGILPRGHLIETDRQGLVAGYIGQTARQTSSLIDQAIGGTLFIDEAYSLVKNGDSANDFGREAIDTLLKRMEDDKGKFIVIAAGYTGEMEHFLESNPGLRSRFTKTVVFEDYNPDELHQITLAQLNSRGYSLASEAKEALRKYYTELYRNRNKSFGNARIVRNLVDEALKNQFLRIADLPEDQGSKEVTKTVLLNDLQSIISGKSEKKQYKVEGDIEQLNRYMHELRNLTGLDQVKKSVEKLISSLKVAKLREKRGMTVLEKNLHAVFQGNPGTGKTTVARLLSKIYKEIGLLEKGHLVEVDRAALVAGYQGQTALKTDDIIKQAIGGTLFIDEAYTLSRGSNDFGQEAIDTLLKRMEDYKDQFIVIVAGYPDEMQKFLSSNPGLQSRFSNIFNFEDYSPRQLLEIAANISNESGYNLDEGALQFLLEIFTRLYNKRDRNFGNARTARHILYETISNQEERISKLTDFNDQDLMTITIEDVEKFAKL